MGLGNRATAFKERIALHTPFDYSRASHSLLTLNLNLSPCAFLIANNRNLGNF